jgi:hypothetical protein
MAQIMYAHVSTREKDKIKLKKNNKLSKIRGLSHFALPPTFAVLEGRLHKIWTNNENLSQCMIQIFLI